MYHIFLYKLRIDLFTASTGRVSADCPTPASVQNATFTTDIDDGMETSYLVWSCEDRYVMAGEADSVIWFCRDDGEWIGETPICVGKINGMIL